MEISFFLRFAFMFWIIGPFFWSRAQAFDLPRRSCLHDPGLISASLDIRVSIQKKNLFFPLASSPIGPMRDEPGVSNSKLNPWEFEEVLSHPSGTFSLPMGTELNILANPICLKESQRTPSDFDWYANDQSHSADIHSYFYRLKKDWDVIELQKIFDEDSCVNMVSPERKYFISEDVAASLGGDPLSSDQDHLRALRYYEALSGFVVPLLVRLSPITIAVIDTGVDFTHPDLKLNRWRNTREIPGNLKDDDGNGYVDDVDGYNFSSQNAHTGPEGTWPENKHGTHVAGLAAARFENGLGVTGIQGLAKIMSLNVFGINGFTRSSVLENAIRYAADEGASIINLSLGGREYSRSMKTALEYAISKGSFIVTAAGNDGLELCSFPGGFGYVSPAIYGSILAGMMVVGSSDVDSGELSRFSNFSRDYVEILAPGAYTSQPQVIGLLSTLPNGSYGLLAGTSMAAPVLSGAAAMVVSWLKTYGYPVAPKSIEEILRAGSRRSYQLKSLVQDGRTLDLVDLLDYLKRHYPSRGSE